MNLLELVRTLSTQNDEAVIYIEDPNDKNSEIILIAEAEESTEPIVIGDKTYYYLIEVFLAKEFIEDWLLTLEGKPTDIQIVDRLHQYVVNDA